MAERAKKKALKIKAKKKTAVARARIRKGSGKIRINKISLQAIMPQEVKEFIMEPIQVSKPFSQEVDIDINVKGGGFMGQAVASRSAIAKAIYEFSGNEKLRKTLIAYDRLLLVDDPRNVEPKKPLGTKARKKKQKSKR